MRCSCSCRAGSKNAHTHTRRARHRVLYTHRRGPHIASARVCAISKGFLWLFNWFTCFLSFFSAFLFLYIFSVFFLATRRVRFLSQHWQLLSGTSRGAFIRGALHKILAKSRTRCQQAGSRQQAAVGVGKKTKAQAKIHAHTHTHSRQVEAAKQQQP